MSFIHLCKNTMSIRTDAIEAIVITNDLKEDEYIYEITVHFNNETRQNMEYDIEDVEVFNEDIKALCSIPETKVVKNGIKTYVFNSESVIGASRTVELGSEDDAQEYRCVLDVACWTRKYTINYDFRDLDQIGKDYDTLCETCSIDNKNLD